MEWALFESDVYSSIGANLLSISRALLTNKKPAFVSCDCAAISVSVTAQRQDSDAKATDK